MVRESWMNDNGLRNVMELIKRQKWEKLFKRRELVHVDAIKEFYAKLTMSHNKKKEVAKSSVRGVDIEFDSERLASILGIPGNNGILKDHELPYGDWLTMVFEDFGVPLVDKQGEEPKRRRDNEIDAPAEEAEEEEEAQNQDFDWEAVVDEAAVQGESGSDDQFFYAQVDAEELVAEGPVVPAFPASPGRIRLVMADGYKALRARRDKVDWGKMRRYWLGIVLIFCYQLALGTLTSGELIWCRHEPPASGLVVCHLLAVPDSSPHLDDAVQGGLNCCCQLLFALVHP
ncbi:hypothetical protein Dimus_024796 [Dionaea muscipula]